MTPADIAKLNKLALEMKAALPPPVGPEPPREHCYAHSLNWQVWVPGGIRGLEFHTKAAAEEAAVKWAAIKGLKISHCRWNQHVQRLITPDNPAIYLVESLTVTTAGHSNYVCRDWTFSNSEPGYLSE